MFIEYRMFLTFLFCCSQANLCYLDVDRCTLQLPEELPNFPQRNDFIAEINEVLRRFDVCAPVNGPVDRLAHSSLITFKLISKGGSCHIIAVTMC